MANEIFSSRSITKALNIKNNDDRIFEGILSAEIVDKQNEVTFVEELMKVLPLWIKRGGTISDTHTNRHVGKGIGYEKVMVVDEKGTEVPGVKIIGQIFKDYELDDIIWDKIKSGDYKGLSFGGATRSDRVPLKRKDGSIAFGLRDLEQYEVAVCQDPAVPWAIITDVNTIAKSSSLSEIKKMNITEREDGKILIRCTGTSCFVRKEEDQETLNKGTSTNNKVMTDKLKEDPHLASGTNDKEEGAEASIGAGKEPTGKKDDDAKPVDMKPDEDKLEEVKAMAKSIDTLVNGITKRFESEDKWKSDIEKTLSELNDKIKGIFPQVESSDKDGSDVKLAKKPFETATHEIDSNPSDKVQVMEKRNVTKVETPRPFAGEARPEDVQKSNRDDIAVLTDIRKGKSFSEVLTDLQKGKYGNSMNTWSSDPQPHIKYPARDW